MPKVRLELTIMALPADNNAQIKLAECDGADASALQDAAYKS